ncbi:Putative hypervirulence associated protein, TUDOR [Septoria linicola]|uniref:Hypervirulence associated protein, TUDOR n=1 Tax=Septoria linicola TaxID=215465 RepID=A0A9Q9AJY1_9PEZI|nr:putative hypervirulence associated protein, TUDOR [Septoria linicola]USW48278.1 Putative hypervirulence associated protein, TUDOR [Septoria linicola]
MPPKGKYTDPKLRDQVKEEIQNSDKGGQPGQWSARKAQMMASEYKKRGGDYTTDKKDKDESQQNLTNWGEEDWQTKDGEGKAKQEDGTEKRYLPKKAWENMSEKEKEETDQKKQAESKEGKQHVENTSKAKESRRKATKDDSKDQKKESNANASSGRSSRSQTKNAQEKSDQSKESEEKANGSKKDPKAKGSKAKQDEKEDEAADEEEAEEEQAKSKSTKGSKAGQKRKDTEQQNGTSKKQKDNDGKATIGSKHMDATEPAQKGSADRLPKEGQKVTWKAMPGYVEGTVKEILKKSKKVDGKQVKASESDPKIVLESEKSGKICVHKPDACFYDDE